MKALQCPFCENKNIAMHFESAIGSAAYWSCVCNNINNKVIQVVHYDGKNRMPRRVNMAFNISSNVFYHTTDGGRTWVNKGPTFYKEGCKE